MESKEKSIEEKSIEEKRKMNNLQNLLLSYEFYDYASSRGNDAIDETVIFNKGDKVVNNITQKNGEIVEVIDNYSDIYDVMYEDKTNELAILLLLSPLSGKQMQPTYKKLDAVDKFEKLPSYYEYKEDMSEKLANKKGNNSGYPSLSELEEEKSMKEEKESGPYSKLSKKDKLEKMVPEVSKKESTLDYGKLNELGEKEVAGEREVAGESDTEKRWDEYISKKEGRATGKYGLAQKKEYINPPVSGEAAPGLRYREKKASEEKASILKAPVLKVSELKAPEVKSSEERSPFAPKSKALLGKFDGGSDVDSMSDKETVSDSYSKYLKYKIKYNLLKEKLNL